MTHTKWKSINNQWKSVNTKTPLFSAKSGDESGPCRPHQAPEVGIISRQSCGSFTGCRFGNASSSSWQSWFFNLELLCDRRLEACQRHQPPPPAAVFQRPNVRATTYHFTSGRSGFCCCRAATVEQSPSRTMTTLNLTSLSDNFFER